MEKKKKKTKKWECQKENTSKQKGFLTRSKPLKKKTRKTGKKHKMGGSFKNVIHILYCKRHFRSQFCATLYSPTR